MTGQQIELATFRGRPGLRIGFGPARFVAIAAACALMLVGQAAQGQASPFSFYPEPVYEHAAPSFPLPPAPKKRMAKRKYPKLAAAPANEPKPHGPLIIAISIDKQHLRIFDDNGVFAESAVSTGKPGHSTPMGIFSVIEKSKWHRSNLYSSAPMPFMQRITWSGVALHAGVVPGYPASHGCIRLPMAFATKLWGWTRLGARVVVTPGEMTPADISNPALLAHIPAPAVAPPQAPSPIASTSKSDKAAIAEPAKLSLGADDHLALRLHSDHAEAPNAKARPELAADRSEASASRVQLADAVSADADHLSGANPSGPGSESAAKDQSRASDTSTDAPPSTSNVFIPKAFTPTASTSKASAKEPAAAAPDQQTQQIMAPKRMGHIAVLISRKENRLYVRQNFEPLFDVPVTIAQNDHPLGTHVFTARSDVADPKTYRWSVMSLPTVVKRASARSVNSREKQLQPELVMETPDPRAAAAALDRITIPKEANARIAEAMAAGGSLVITDRGLGDETGLGTDFIVLLR